MNMPENERQLVQQRAVAQTIAVQQADQPTTPWAGPELAVRRWPLIHNSSALLHGWLHPGDHPVAHVIDVSVGQSEFLHGFPASAL